MRVSSTFGQPEPEPREPRSQSDPFNILVLADLGAGQSWSAPRKVDRDNFEELFERAGVSVRFQLDNAAPPVEIEFKDPEDFHPDRLFDRLELFAALRTRRRRLQNNDTFDAEAAAILAQGGTSDETAKTDSGGGAPQAGGTSESRTPPEIDAAGLLDAALEETQSRQQPLAQQIAGGHVNLDDYVRQLVEPYVLARPDPRQPEFLASVDEAIAATMRRVLHDPHFQQVEAAWLGLKMLVRRLETDASLQIQVLHVPRTELAADLCGSDDLTASRHYRLLVESARVPGAHPWALAVGDYSFDHSSADVELLGRLANVQGAAGTALVAAASPRIAGCNDLAAHPDPDDWTPLAGEDAQRWQRVRSAAGSDYVSLALPRILARRPYGSKTDPIESFAFEEIPDGTPHEDYLWMNPAFGIATLFGQAFTRAGWSLRRAFEPQLEDLPIHVFQQDTESVMKPCGEVELVLRAGNVLGELGLTAVHSVRDAGAVRIPGVRALAPGQDSLRGPWA